MMSTNKTNEVTVLIDDEQRNPQFLTRSGIGMSEQPPGLCRYVEPTRIFGFDRFGLFSQDKKITEYLKTRRGIIIIIDSARINKMSIERIRTVVKDIPNKLIMILIEKGRDTDTKETITHHFSNLENDHVKTFFIDFDLRNFFLKPNEDTPYKAKDWFQNNLYKNFVPITEKPIVTSETVPIEDMVKMFENRTMPLTLWDHYGRLRIVHYSIMKYGFDKTIDQNEWLCTHWRQYKDSIGHGKLWHYTLTRFWANILFNLQRKYAYESFDALYKNHSKIQQGSLFKKYYSEDVLFTDHARNNWVKPNLKEYTCGKF